MEGENKLFNVKKNIVIIAAIVVINLSQFSYLLVPNISRIPIAITLMASVVVLMYLKPEDVITSPTKIRELYVQSPFGKQAGFKPLSEIKGVDIGRQTLINPFDKSKIHVFWFYNISWIDAEVYAGEYRKGEPIDAVLLRYINHNIEQKSKDVILSEIKKEFLSGNIRENMEMLKKYGVLRKPAPRHRRRPESYERTEDTLVEDNSG